MEIVVEKEINKVIVPEETRLYSIVRYVQDGDDDYETIDKMFCNTSDYHYSSQPVIDYLSTWDGFDNELVEEIPQIGAYDNEWLDENDNYTLLYNHSVGGSFLLFREANDEEKDWWYNKYSVNI